MNIFCNDFVGNMKELHGVDCAPYYINLGSNQTKINEMFSYMGTPHSRLHDCVGEYGGAYFVDIPNIFKDFSADENDEKNYDFYYTDEYISAIINAGTQIVYRLGITIEWGSKKYRANPPEDFTKWARICEHIVAHYNKGWANGFHYNIEYWEIWNEPENPPMWTGTKEQFLQLYKVASKHLKAKFPEIKVGGYGSCGFYAAFRANMSDFFKGFLTWFEDFLKMCKNDNCPLDFYTWHIYTSDVGEIAKSANYVKNKLLEYGFDKTESHLNEWNYGAEGGGFDNMDTMIGAGFISSALISLQYLPVDKAQYYCCSDFAAYNGMIHLRTKAYTPVFHVFWAFNRLFTLKNQLKADDLKWDDPNVLFASDGEKFRAFISCYKKKDKIINLNFDGLNSKSLKVFKLTENDGFVFEREVPVDDCKIYCHTGAVYYIENL